LIGKVFGHGGNDNLRKAARTVFDEYPTDGLADLLERICSEYPAMAQNSVF